LQLQPAGVGGATDLGCASIKLDSTRHWVAPGAGQGLTMHQAQAGPAGAAQRPAGPLPA
jgi:hypothetical protein